MPAMSAVLQANAPGAPADQLATRCIGPVFRPYAWVFRPGRMSGTHFLTPSALDLQVGVLERARGERVHPHTHVVQSRTLNSSSELLYVEHGRVLVDVYDEDWQLLADEMLSRGEMLLLLRGGHALTVIDDARVIEVRQGPYVGVDKRFRDDA